jgi:hypothetical protein
LFALTRRASARRVTSGWFFTSSFGPRAVLLRHRDLRSHFRRILDALLLIVLAASASI